MKILVTGGAGFIGSHLVDKLIKRGEEVLVVDNLSSGKKENLNSQAKFFKMDIQDPAVSEVFEKEKPEVVFHYAAQIDIRRSARDPIEDATINILGSLNFLENCKESGVKKFIFASSGGAIYGEANIIPTPEDFVSLPQSPYGIAKLAVENYLDFYRKAHNLDYVSLRYSNIYGPRQNSKGEAGVVGIFTDKLLHNEVPTIFGSGEQTRDFLFVGDAVEVALRALDLSLSRESRILNVGSGKETSINQLYNLISEKVGKDIRPEYGPAKMGDVKRSCLDYSRAQKELGWSPKYSLREGVAETVKWFTP